MRLERHKEPYIQHRKLDSQTRYVAAREVTDTQTDRQTDTQNDYRNPATHAPRVNKHDVKPITVR
jgi:hypothetical protein